MALAITSHRYIHRCIRDMRKRYAVIAGFAIAMPFGSAHADASKTTNANAAASWATMDSNADGALSPDEVAATPWEAKFDSMDANSDGKVTKQEFGAHMDAMKKTQKTEQSGDPDSSEP